MIPQHSECFNAPRNSLPWMGGRARKGTGYVSMKQVFARGLALKALSIPVFLVLAWTWWPLVMR